MFLSGVVVGLLAGIAVPFFMGAGIVVGRWVARVLTPDASGLRLR